MELERHFGWALTTCGKAPQVLFPDRSPREKSGFGFVSHRDEIFKTEAKEGTVENLLPR